MSPIDEKPLYTHFYSVLFRLIGKDEKFSCTITDMQGLLFCFNVIVFYSKESFTNFLNFLPKLLEIGR